MATFAVVHPVGKAVRCCTTPSAWAAGSLYISISSRPSGKTAFFHQFTRSLFFHRRKFLRSVVISAMKGKLDKAAVDELLVGMQLGADARAEQLDVATVMELSEVFRCRLEEEGIA